MAETDGGNERTYRNEPRRRFSVEYKRQIVQALLGSTMSLPRVAREHDEPQPSTLMTSPPIFEVERTCIH